MLANDMLALIWCPIFIILSLITALIFPYTKYGLILLIIWCLIFLIYLKTLRVKAKKMGLPERSFIFNNHYEPHIEGLAKKNKNKFIRLFLDRILAANEIGIHKTIFITQYVDERTLAKFFGGENVIAENLDFMQYFANITLNYYLWKHKTKKKVLRFTIYTDNFDQELTNKLKAFRNRLIEREKNRG